MADTPTGRQEYASLRARIEELLAADWVEAAVAGKFGELNFRGAQPTLQGIREILQVLQQMDLGILPLHRVNTIFNSLTQLKAVLEQMRDFNIATPNAQQRRDQISNEIVSQFNNLFDNVGIAISIWSAARLNVASLTAQLEARIDERLQRLSAPYTDEVAKIQAAGKEATETLRAIKTAAGQVGVTENAKIFESQAGEHLDSSEIWAIATVVMAGITVAWGAVALWLIPIPANAGASTVVQEAIAKLIVFSGLSYGLVWCARNYSANRHNYVLNKHRQNSLTTFETFVKAAGADVDTKNAVLLQATTAIFTAQATGYSSKEPEVDNPTRLLEIVRSAKSGA